MNRGSETYFHRQEGLGLPCTVCGRPTGDPRRTVKRCFEHSAVGQWIKLNRDREWRKAVCYGKALVTRRKEEAAPTKESTWLRVARRRLRETNAYLRTQ